MADNNDTSSTATVPGWSVDDIPALHGQEQRERQRHRRIDRKRDRQRFAVHSIPDLHGQEQREEQRQRRIDRKRDHQRMSHWEDFSIAGDASNAIELLDDDDDDNDCIDLSSAKPAAVAIKNWNQTPAPIILSPEVQVLETPLDVLPNTNQRKKPPPMPSMSPALAVVEGGTSHVLRVLEIFPDADVAYVQKKLREQKNNFAIVVSVLSENDNYPRQKKRNFEGTPGATTNGNGSIHGNNTIIRGTKASEPKHDYSSHSASLEISQQYRLEVMNLLMYDFSFLKKKGILVLSKQNQERYTLTRNRIHDMIVGKSPNDPPPVAASATKLEQEENENYQLLRSILVRGSFPKETKQRMGRFYCLHKPRKKIGVPIPPITDPLLLDEHYHFEQRFQQWLRRVQNRLRGQAANKLALENGSAIECSCCFDDVAVSECVPCKKKGHLFCKACIVQYVESQVFGSGNLGIDNETKKPALEIKCCEGSGCNSGFPDEMLQKVLSPKTWEKYSEMQARAQIEQAGLGENLAMCPKCGYQAEVPQMQNIFECPIECCRFSSCRKCGKASHIPLRCEEVLQKNRRDEGRLKIEEALSETKMRTCPKCNKKFIKSDGCNKMTCACGMKMCYVCRKPLDKVKGNVYIHFCQIFECDHLSCGKCRLYSNDAEDDAQAMREAGIAAKEAFEANLQNENDGGGEAVTTKDLQLNVDEIMRDPSQIEMLPAKKQRRREIIQQPPRQQPLPQHQQRPQQQQQFQQLLQQRNNQRQHNQQWNNPNHQGQNNHPPYPRR